jgi:hypothetical protein
MVFRNSPIGRQTIMKYLVKVLKGYENVYGRNCQSDCKVMQVNLVSSAYIISATLTKGMRKRIGRMREEENSDHISLFIA